MDDPGDPVTERAKTRVGSTLKEKWRLDELIGVGGMAAVYAGTHTRNGMRVALKMLHPELSVDGEIRTRFLREGYLANKVEHPGAVAIIDDEIADDGGVFLVMELLDGETLAHRFERKARSLVTEEILLIADQVLDVLAAAHEKQIIHRDIKPDNIFLTRSGGVKVLDFGIARLRELSTSSTATRSGSTMGTPAYMAPEQARARWDEVDARTDLWAVGATMFKLLTGRVVHVADTVNEQLLAAMTQPAPPLGSVVPTAPIPVLQVVDKALAFEKNERWPDARIMQKAVKEAYQALSGGTDAAVRLSFDDNVAVGHADTVAVASKVPTSLTAAHDSALFGSRRPRRKSRLGLILMLGLLSAVVYFALSHGTKVSDLPPFFADADGGGVLPTGVLNIPSGLVPSAFVPPELGGSGGEPSGLSRVEGAPVGAPAAVPPPPEPARTAPEPTAAPSPTPTSEPTAPASASASPAPTASASPQPTSEKRPAPSAESTKSSGSHKSSPPPRKKHRRHRRH